MGLGLLSRQALERSLGLLFDERLGWIAGFGHGRSGRLRVLLYDFLGGRFEDERGGFLRVCG